MQKIYHSLARCYHDTSRDTRRAIAACLAYLLVVVITLFLISCASTPAGLHREQVIYSAGTNLVGYVQQLVPYTPAPVQLPIEALLACATAVLGAWNLHQQVAIRKLKNGNGGTKPLAQAASPSPPTA